MCGEKSLLLGSSGSMGGSPPRMRGKEIRHLIEMCLVGITPAHAGKRAITLIQEVLFKDHPRTCGEKGCTVVLRP